MRRLLVLLFVALPLLAQESEPENAWTRAVHRMDAEMHAACGDDETMAAVARLLPMFDAVDGTAKTSRELRGKLQKYFAYSRDISPTLIRRMLASPDAGMQLIAVNFFSDHSDAMDVPENRRALLEAFDRPSTPDDTRVAIVGVFSGSPEIYAEIESRARVLTRWHGDVAHGAAIWMVAAMRKDEARLREYLAAPERALHEQALWLLVQFDFGSSPAAVNELASIARDPGESTWVRIGAVSALGHHQGQEPFRSAALSLLDPRDRFVDEASSSFGGGDSVDVIFQGFEDAPEVLEALRPTIAKMPEAVRADLMAHLDRAIESQKSLSSISWSKPPAEPGGNR